MPRWGVNLIAMWISQLLVLAGFAAMIPFVSLFIQNELKITDKEELAWAVAMFSFCGSAGYAIFCPIWGKLSDRFGVKPMLLRGTFGTAILFPLMAYCTSVGWFIFLRFATAALAGTTAACHIMIARNTPANRQGFAQGTLSTACWGGSMLGMVIGGLVIHYYSYIHAFWLCGIGYFISGIPILFTQDDFVRQVKVKVRRTDFWSWLPKFSQASWMMFGTFLLMGFVRNVEVPYVALKVETITGPETAAYWTGIVSAVVCCGAILAGVITGYMADKYPARTLLLPVMLVSALMIFLQGFCNNLLLFAISRTLLYVFAAGIQPILQKILSEVTPHRKRGSVFGFASSMNSGGAMLAALAGGAIFAQSDLNAVFYYTAAFFVIGLPILLWLLKRAQSRFVFHRAGHRQKTERYATVSRIK